MNNLRKNFIRLAENRTRRAMKDIRLLGNLSNRNSYEYQDKDVREIFAAVEEEIRAARQRFELSASGRESGFSLENRGEAP